MEPKPLMLGKLAVFAAVNMTITMAARRKGKIAPDEEIAEPMLIMATSIEIADYVLQHSCAYFNQKPYMVAIGHQLYQNHLSDTCRPLIKLVTNNKDFPFYIYN